MKTVLLGDVAQIISGQSPQSINYNKDGQGLPLYQGKKDFGAMFTADPSVWTTETTKVAEKGDVLISVRAPVGPVNFASQKMNIGRGLAAIRPWEGLDPQYLYHFMKLNEPEIAKLGSGATFNSINRTHLKNLEIPYPDVEEQRRIVKVLDEAFEKIERAKANTEKNLKNSQELFHSRLEQLFTSTKWSRTKLEDLIQKTSNINWSKENFTERKYIDLTSVNRSSSAITSLVEVNKNNAPSRAKKIVRTNDIIFGTTRPTLKRIATISPEFDNQICSTGFCVIRANAEKINPKLIYYFLKTKNFMDNMEKLQRGASYPAVTDNDVKSQVIKFPKVLIEQAKVIKDLDGLSEQTQKLQKLYQQKLDDLEELKQSILKQAFEGKL